MTALALLPALKADLGIGSDRFDDRLTARIETAMQRIAEHGVTLDDSEAAQDLVLMYAAWLWRDRVTGAPMPRMLQWALHNTLFNQKMQADAEAGS